MLPSASSAPSTATGLGDSVMRWTATLIFRHRLGHRGDRVDGRFHVIGAGRIALAPVRLHHLDGRPRVDDVLVHRRVIAGVEGLGQPAGGGFQRPHGAGVFLGRLLADGVRAGRGRGGHDAEHQDAPPCRAHLPGRASR